MKSELPFLRKSGQSPFPSEFIEQREQLWNNRHWKGTVQNPKTLMLRQQCESKRKIGRVPSYMSCVLSPELPFDPPVYTFWHVKTA